MTTKRIHTHSIQYLHGFELLVCNLNKEDCNKPDVVGQWIEEADE